MEFFQQDINLYFCLILPVIAFLYASIGHGGASGYIALMAILSFQTTEIKPTALTLNLFVSGISFYHYYKGGYFNKKLFLIFALTSIPAAFIGGFLDIETEIYKKVLAIFLLVSVIKITNIFSKSKQAQNNFNLIIGLIVGASIGFFSGLIGIGGGIILSPIILLLNWGNMKQAAAVSALFIWVNSFAGLSGQIYAGVNLNPNIAFYIILALLGGFLGSYFGVNKFNNNLVKKILAFVLITASVKLFFT